MSETVQFKEVYDTGYNHGSRDTLLNYRTALKKKIEDKRKEILGDIDETVSIDDQGRLEAYDYTLQLIDSTTI